MRCCLSIILLSLPLVGCSSKDSPKAGPQPADPETAAEIRGLLPDAAALDMGAFVELARSEAAPNIETMSPFGTLTAGVLTIRVEPGVDRGDAFDYLDDGPNPKEFVQTLLGADQKRCTVLHPEYITDFNCDVEGDTAKGTIKFQARDTFRGRVNYRAVRVDGKWRIEELDLPGHFKSERQKDGKWKLTFAESPDPVNDPALASDVRALQGNWILERGSNADFADAPQQPMLVIEGDALEVRIPKAIRDSAFRSGRADFVLTQFRKQKMLIVFHVEGAEENSPKRFQHEYDVTKERVRIDRSGPSFIPPGTYQRYRASKKTEDPLNPFPE